MLLESVHGWCWAVEVDDGKDEEGDESAGVSPSLDDAGTLMGLMVVSDNCP